MLYVITFFFTCFGYSLVLHSFPTRRSSDLVGSDFPVVVQSMTNTDTADPVGTAEQVLALAKAGSDRKSTRLNSSHSSISYAADCVKKKSNSLIKTMNNTNNTRSSISDDIRN